jgi:sulfate permease, SulP family
MPNGASSSHLIRPKLITTLAGGYGVGDLRVDAMAGLTVAILALPLSMAIAVASGVSPDRGLYAAVIGGFLVSALGGSRYQIGGPAGAFIVLVSGAVTQLGVDGLLLAVALSGVMLAFLGLLRLGGLIRRVPHTVAVGFTAGIAVTIAASQIKDLAGLTLEAPEPTHILPKLAALTQAWPSANLTALGVGLASAFIILVLKRVRPTWPGMLIAVVFSAVATGLLGLPIETIGSRFGGIPHGLPAPRFPDISLPRLVAVLPAAASFTLLGGLESLLSARVADSMTGRFHRPNMELVAQGVANVASALFGGICVSGTIARTATNIRAGARSPIAGMLHAVFLLAFLMVAARMANEIPLAALAGLLVVVAWNMVERAEISSLLHGWRSGAVLVATFGFTVLHDLMSGIAAGCGLAIAFWASAKLQRRLSHT